MKRKEYKIVIIILILLLISYSLFATTVEFPLDDSMVLSFDRSFMYPYSKQWSIVSDVTQFSSFFAPTALMLSAPKEDWLRLGFTYSVASIIAYGTRELLKETVNRSRPYMYDPRTPSTLVKDPDNNRSFPSGHTVMAFTGASFLATTYITRYPNSPYKIPVVVGSFILASATGALRVASGNHFVTDVLAGAAIGTLCGVLIPLLFQK